MTSAFVIRPFETKTDSSGREIDFEQVHTQLIQPALTKTGYGPETFTGQIVESGDIRRDMFEFILEADLVVCDITIHNANVFYELGIRHSLRKKHTVLIRGMPTADEKPFDLSTDRYLRYSVDDPAKSLDALVESINKSKASASKTDSPVFGFLPRLREAALLAVQEVPPDFEGEVKRAQAAVANGWLRLMSREVRERRFKWQGLYLIAKAQSDLRDWEGACVSWEEIREGYVTPVEADRALAKIYGERYREAGNQNDLVLSEQAIDRVLDSGAATTIDRARGLAQRGHNQETRWRLELRQIRDVNMTERRRQAASRVIVGAYRTYQEAFVWHPAYVYSGLAALRMGNILIHLSEEESWFDAFNTDDKADDFKKELEDKLPMLHHFVAELLEVKADQVRLSASEQARAAIGRAELLLLGGERESRVKRAYKDAIHQYLPLAYWNAVRYRLELYEELGIHHEVAHAVIDELERRFQEQRQDAHPHVILVADYGLHEPSQQGSEQRMKNMFRDELNALLKKGQRLEVFASASPGVEILFHEVCSDLNVPSIICLPIPANDYVSKVFKNLDDWRERFHALKRRREEENHPLLELSDRGELPKWLYDSQVDPWQRGSQWLLEMALARGGQVTLFKYGSGGESDSPSACLEREARKHVTVNIVPLGEST